MSAEDLIGEVVADRYEIQGRLGEGAMGSVYRARQLWLERDVALKILRQRRDVQPRARRRLHREARVVARISHPHVVQVYDYGEAADGSPYLVMELVPGQTPAPLRRSVSLDRIVAAGAAALSGLGAAHARGILHRDLKPANMVLRDGAAEQAVLLDFGIAAVLRDERAEGTLERMLVHDAELVGDAGLTRAGTVVGTPLYMSPEQARGLPATEQSDLYSMAVILFEWLAGAPPFSGAVPEVLRGHAFVPHPPLRPKPGMLVPRDLSSVVERALHKRPELRFESAETMREALLDAAGRAVAEVAPSTLATADDLAPAPVPRLLQEPPFVGRARLVARLQQLLGSRLDGPGGAVRVLGEEGVGKSRLVSEVLAGLPAGTRVGQATVGGPGEPPLRPIQAAVLGALGLRGLAGDRLHLELASRAEELGLGGAAASGLAEWLTRDHLSSAPLEDPGDQWRRLVALQRLLRGLAREQPVLLVLDDAHRLDPSAATFVGELMVDLRVERAPLVVLAIEGADAPKGTGLALVAEAAVVAVPRLDRADVETLLRGLSPLEPPTARSLAARSGGSPRFAVALLRHLAAADALEPSSQGLRLRPGRDVGLPGSVAALLEGRLTDAIGEQPMRERILEAAAVLGGTPDVGLLERILEASDEPADGAAFDDALDAVVDAGVLREVPGPGDRLEWEHPLLREEVLQRSGRLRRRRRVARAAAEALQAQADPSVAPAAFELLRLAGDEEAAAGLAGVAARQYLAAGQLDAAQGALQLGADRGDRSTRQRCSLQLGLLHNHAGDSEAARRVLQALLSELDDPFQRARAQLGLGRALRNSGDAQGAAVQLARAIEAFSGDPREAAILGWGRALRTLAGVARSLPQRPTLTPPPGLVAAARTEVQQVENAITFGALALSRDDPRQAQRWFSEAAERMSEDDPERPDVLCDLGRAARESGDAPSARSALEAALTQARRLGLHRTEAECANELGELERGQGRPEAALLRYERAEHLWRLLGSPYAILPALNAALAECDVGDAAAARRRLAELNAHQPDPPAGFVVPFRLTTAVVAAASGADEAARSALERALPLLPAGPLPAEVRGVLLALRRQWERREATEHIEALDRALATR